MTLTHKMYGLLAVLLVQLFISHGTEAAAVISIDLGSEWMKVGIVSPGVPMEIVLNKESKRKTPAVLAFRDEVRTFGEDAQTVGVRFPKLCYKYLLDLLGKSYDHPLIEEYRNRFPYYDIKKSERGTPVFVHDDKTEFTPEELVAQLLHKAKDFAEISHGQQITESVITVPGYFNQAERNAIKEAASLAGLNVLQLINDYTAVAVNYGIFRRKEINETAWYTLFFDMGATSTTAALVEYKTVKIKEKGYVETVPQLQVIGVGYDRTLGGLEMTLRLRDHLIEGWKKQGGGDVTKSPRAMEKLFKEAERLKIILSANTEFFAQIESLLDDKDFKMQVSRAEFETLCQDLWPRVTGVLSRALAAAGGAGAGAKVVLVGGASRVPAVQQALKDITGHEPSKSINADEAATLGAVYRAASLATGYKVASFNVRDAVLLPIQVVFTRLSDGQERLITRTLFGHMNPYPQKKVITFNKYTEDFTFNVNYASLEHIPFNELANIGSTNLTEVLLKGVADALSKHQGENVDYKGIKAHFNMDDSGILNLVNVEFVAEKTVTEEDDSTLSKLGSTISKLFSSDSENADAKPEEPAAEKNDTSTNETNTEKQNATQADAKPKPKVVTVKEPITSEQKILNLKPLDKAQFKESKNKIVQLNTVDRERAERESALNSLEAFVVDTQMKMDMDEYTKCGSKDEIEAVKALCSQVSEWLEDEGYEASTEALQKKLQSVQEKTQPIFYKHWEHTERPDAVAAMRNALNQSREFLKMARNYTAEVNPDQDVFSNVEISLLENKIIDSEEWLNKSLAAQEKQKKHEDLKLTVDEIREKITAVEREVKYLLNKLKIWRPKKPAKKNADANKTEEVVVEKEAKEEKTVPETQEESPSEQAEPATEESAGTEIPLQIDNKDEHAEL